MPPRDNLRLFPLISRHPSKKVHKKDVAPIRLVTNPDQLTEEERRHENEKQQEVANLEASIKRLKAGLRQVMPQQRQ